MTLETQTKEGMFVDKSKIYIKKWLYYLLIGLALIGFLALVAFAVNYSGVRDAIVSSVSVYAVKAAPEISNQTVSVDQELIDWMSANNVNQISGKFYWGDMILKDDNGNIPNVWWQWWPLPAELNHPGAMLYVYTGSRPNDCTTKTIDIVVDGLPTGYSMCEQYYVINADYAQSGEPPYVMHIGEMIDWMGANDVDMVSGNFSWGQMEIVDGNGNTMVMTMTTIPAVLNHPGARFYLYNDELVDLVCDVDVDVHTVDGTPTVYRICEMVR